ncbi:MAG: deoxyribose-phosphate aldolase [Synergistaceae bacterium]|jgi:deoxyribose-phosphate aldolase|nr:deoxyribose-phosphate aldolase [Synergistaceae bacterium]
MTKLEICAHVDHTALKAFTTWEDVRKLCEEALKYRFASVCIPPCYVKRVKEAYGDKVVVCTVIGFPLGYEVTPAKAAEASRAAADGADEIDMVINVADVKNGDFGKVREEIEQIRTTTKGKVLKVIVETCYLSEEEKIKLCEIVTQTGVDYIKTSTGFGTAGAALEDVKLFKRRIGPAVKIKAAGGIRTFEDMERYIAEGCERIGTSSAANLLEEEESR